MYVMSKSACMCLSVSVSNKWLSRNTAAHNSKVVKSQDLHLFTLNFAHAVACMHRCIILVGLHDIAMFRCFRHFINFVKVLVRMFDKLGVCWLRGFTFTVLAQYFSLLLKVCKYILDIYAQLFALFLYHVFTSKAFLYIQNGRRNILVK